MLNANTGTSSLSIPCISNNNRVYSCTTSTAPPSAGSTNNATKRICQIEEKETFTNMILFSEFVAENSKRHPLLTSEFSFEIYTVLCLFVLIGQYWVLHGITLVILAHITDIIFSWFVHVKEAREIRHFKSWLVWWTRIGLDFASSTAEGELVHRVLVANTLNFWNLIGKNYTVQWFNDIFEKGRAKTLSRAKEQLQQLTINHNNFAHSQRENNPG